MPHRTLSEFALIARYFQRPNPLRHALLGVGDDCALMQPPAGELLAISTDTLVAGRHFFDDVDPATLGHKAFGREPERPRRQRCAAIGLHPGADRACGG